MLNSPCPLRKGGARAPCLTLQAKAVKAAILCRLWLARYQPWTRVTTWMHNACYYVIHVCSSTTCARSTETHAESQLQEAYLPVCYDQWWVSHVAGAIANCTHSSYWKEAIAVHWELIRERGRQCCSANDARTFEQSVFSKSQMIKTLKTP